MAAHSNDKTYLGNGLQENVRSYLLERVIDFKLANLSSSNYYEIGTLPKGFVPRTLALIELEKCVKANSSGTTTFKVYKTVEDASIGSATEIGTVTVGDTNLALATKSLLTVTNEVTQSESSPYAVSAVTSTVGTLDGAQLAVKVGAALESGRVKVAIAGDFMTGIWDEGEKAPPVKPDVVVKKNIVA